MSYYDDDTNPHFWLRPPPSDFSAPPLTQPGPRQHWDGHLHHPDQVQQPDSTRVRPRPRQQSPVAPRPRSRTEHDDHLYHPDQQQPDPIKTRQRPAISSPRIPTEHTRQWPKSPPSRHQEPPSHFPPVVMPGQTHIPSQDGRKSKPQSSHHPRPHHVSFEQGASHPSHPRENLTYPQPNRTKPITWFGAVFCVILWLVIILGGLLVLAIYLLYRPRAPHFDISSATLNSVYFDMGYLLNSDITVLANFTNPNSKVKVDFSYVILKLYYNKYLIANQYIEPFSAFNTESKLEYVQFVTSQVRLPVRVAQQLITQVQRNRVTFEVDGIFHARSNFGSFLRYSYWLYSHCQIQLTGPPSGAMLTSYCKTKD